jgi:hypothetical protein
VIRSNGCLLDELVIFEEKIQSAASGSRSHGSTLGKADEESPNCQKRKKRQRDGDVGDGDGCAQDRVVRFGMGVIRWLFGGTSRRSFFTWSFCVLPLRRTSPKHTEREQTNN